MWINTKLRTNDSEIMDDFALQSEPLRDALDKIAKINRLLGGNRLTLQGLQHLVKGEAKDKEIILVDIGCGNGDMLRAIAEYGIRNEYIFKLIGIDANAFTISHAKALSLQYKNISYRCEDIFEAGFETLHYDIVLCTLTLHHFKDEEIERLVKVFYEKSSLGIVINDLHRSATAYWLFKAFCFVFQLNKMTKDDGLVSILRGFKKVELEQYSKKIQLEKYTIQWKWAFRFQWIIQKI